MLAAHRHHLPAMQYLLEEQGASMTESARGDTVWRTLSSLQSETSAAELSSFLKVVVMLEDARDDFIARLSLQHAHICTQGRQLRAQLPSYLEQQRAVVITHCPLPAVLQSLVGAYAATTPEDMWTDGLRVQAPRAKRGRMKADENDEEDGEDVPPLRRSLRLRQESS
jgi:hypothetical protein